jgi:hypothetical protein
MPRLEEIEAKPMPKEWNMRCPRCQRMTTPYGGFGSGTNKIDWPTTGKYTCEDWAGVGPACGRGWLGVPSTGAIIVIFE